MCIKFGYLIITVGLYLEYNFQILKYLFHAHHFALNIAESFINNELMCIYRSYSFSMGIYFRIY